MSCFLSSECSDLKTGQNLKHIACHYMAPHEEQIRGSYGTSFDQTLCDVCKESIPPLKPLSHDHIPHFGQIYQALHRTMFDRNT